MTDPNNLSRVDRHSKRRNNHIQLIVLIVLAILCAILLVSLMVKGDKNETNSESGNNSNEAVVHNENESKINEENETNKTNNNENEEKNEADNETNENEDEKDETKDGIKDGITKKADYPDDLSTQTMHTTDENVDNAVVADWPAIGTNQTGTHTVNFEDGSDDRNEIKTAITYVTDLTEDDMVEHWVGNGGDQKVIATVSNKNQDKNYKVYLQWETDKGWKPTKVETLKSVSTD